MGLQQVANSRHGREHDSFDGFTVQSFTDEHERSDSSIHQGRRFDSNHSDLLIARKHDEAFFAHLGQPHFITLIGRESLQVSDDLVSCFSQSYGEVFTETIIEEEGKVRRLAC
jgi:hypothetical protein